MNEIKYILDAAKDFRTASEILKSGRLENDKLIMPFRAMIVTLTFSAELYIKCLLSIEKANVHDHSLKELYKRLSETVRKKIESCYKSESAITSIDELLDEYNNVFVNWRYIYEKQNKDILLNHMPDFQKFVDCIDKMSVSEIKNSLICHFKFFKK